MNHCNQCDSLNLYMVPGNSVAEAVLLNLPWKEASSAALPSASGQVTAVPANKCSCLLQRLTGWGETDTVQTPSLLLENPPSHMHIPITQLKKSPLRTGDISPVSGAWQSSAHYQQPVLSLSPKWPVQTQVLLQWTVSASVSHGREHPTLNSSAP